MSAPLTIRFATDHSAAKAGMQDLAASVVSNMVKVSNALNTGVQANGGYGATVKTLATNVVKDVTDVANAGLVTAANSNLSIVATAGAMGAAASQTKTAGVVMTGALAAARAQAAFTFGIIRTEAAATFAALRNSPTAVGALGAAAGFGVLLLVLQQTAAAAKAAEARIEELDKIAKDAADAGVGTTFLQGLTGQAKDAGLKVDQVTSALQRAREAATSRIGEGGKAASSPIEDRLAEHVKAGNISQGDLERYQAADSQEARIRIITDLVEQLRKKGAELAGLDIAGRFFGQDFESKLRTGVDMLGLMRKALDGMTAAGGERVISEAEIQRAQALKDRIQEINNKLADGMAPVMRDILLYQQQQEGAWLDTKDRIADCVVAAGRLYQAVKDIGSAIGNADVFKNIRDWLDQKGMIDHAEVERIEQMLNGGKALSKVGAPKDGETQPGEAGPLAIRVQPKRDKSNSLPATSHSRGGSEKDSIDTYIEGLQKSAAALRAEAEAFNKSNVEKAQAIALAKANEIATANGTKLTEEQTAKILSAAAASATYRDKLADLEQAQSKAAETARYFGNTIADSLGDAIFEGKSLQNIFLDISKMGGRGALQALFTGQGPLASFLGTAPAASAGSSAVGGVTGMFASMFRANGGPVQAGQAYTVGEMGQEIFVPNQDGRMVPIARGGGFGGGGGNTVQVIDQRTMSAAAPEVRQGSNGSTQIILRDIEGAVGQRAMRGQGPFAGAIGGAAGRRG